MAAEVHTLLVPLMSIELVVLIASCVSVSTEPYLTQTLVREQQYPGGDGMQGMPDTRKLLATEKGTNSVMEEGLRSKGGMAWEKALSCAEGEAASSVQVGVVEADEHTR